MTFNPIYEHEHYDNWNTDSSIKILAIGDPHFKETTLDSARTFIKRIQSVIQQEHPDIVVVLGDVLHDHAKLNTQALNTAYAFIDMIRNLAPVYVLVGNHDYINNDQFCSTQHWMNGMKEWNNVVICDDVKPIETESGLILLCPYVPPGRFEEALRRLKVHDWMDARAIFCHQEFKNCKMGAILSEQGDEWSETHPYVISGHIHDKQRIPGIFYTGSSIQHAFGESPHKTISMCCFEKNRIAFYGIELNMETKMIITLTPKELEEFKPKPNTKYRINLESSIEEYKMMKRRPCFKNLARTGHKVHMKPPQLKQSTGNSIPLNITRSFETILYDSIKHDPEMIKLYDTFCKFN
jgi:DNA repair exonuclease SbcCD nuclease subunit